jgi:TatD DNase family protein
MLVDSHCHFDLPEFDGEHQHILSKCWEVGIERLLIPGLSIEQFTRLLLLQETLSPKQTSNQLSKQNSPAIDICLGCHPFFLPQLNDAEQKGHNKQLFALGEKYAQNVVAIGECGLDGSLALPMDYQETILRQQISLAKHLDKPLILHHRQSHNALIRCLKQEAFINGGIIHAFSGSQQIADTYIEMGFLLGVGGTITYDRAVKTRRTIANIDLVHLVLETDAPDMPISGYQGQANSPVRLPLVAKCLAELRNADYAIIARQTSDNYKRMFSVSAK